MFTKLCVWELLATMTAAKSRASVPSDSSSAKKLRQIGSSSGMGVLLLRTCTYGLRVVDIEERVAFFVSFVPGGRSMRARLIVTASLPRPELPGLTRAIDCSGHTLRQCRAARVTLWVCTYPQPLPVLRPNFRWHREKKPIQV